MIAPKFFYEILLIIYGSTVFFYFLDFLYHNRKANQIAFWLLSMVWLLQTIFLLVSFIQSSTFPIQSFTGGLYAYSWIIVAMSLFIHRFVRVEFFLFFMSIAGFLVLLLHVALSIQQADTSFVETIMHEWLISHIVLAFVSYGLFTVSFVLAALFLIQYRLLKMKQGYKWLRRLKDLEGLELKSFQTITIAQPLLLLSIILGVVWAYVSDSVFYWYDSKTIGSIVVFAVYCLYLYLRIGAKYRGKVIAYINIVSFIILLINFILFNQLSNFHI
ncbi:cytochrome C assembly family protein [Saliterribacillus persicus]|uniref:HemX protein n=1 Tax=Saliterribacillus persicus TaxID=930114 RepID=A0A368XEU8_9BACI|nr:cytochrome c biogenesis protein CcsA [Saliterribacillus persicus]RCW66375.1 HemX protein [Saliterribacillus persicus]